MGELSDRLHEEMDALRTARDDLRVRLHLGRAEVRDRWEKLEKKWQHAEAKLKVLREQAAESGKDVGEAARLLLDELKEGVDQLRKLI